MAVQVINFFPILTILLLTLFIEQFEPFLRKYFETYKYKSITTDTFRKFYETHFANVNAIKKIDWDTWLNAPGLPPIIPEFDMTYAKVCNEFTKRFIDWDLPSSIPFSQDDVKSLRPEQLVQLLQNIMAEKPQSIQKLEQFEERFGLKGSKNSEIKFRWIMIGLRAHWEEMIDEALDWVVQVGRMKFVRPLYRELYKWEAAKDRAIKVYEGYKKNMMHVTAYTVGRDLKLIKD